MLGLNTLRRRWILSRVQLPNEVWDAVLSRVLPAARLPHAERERLRDLVVVFLHEKSIEGAADLEVTDATRLLVASWACLPILHLGLDWYDDWDSVVIYPGLFRARHEYMDETGVVHKVDRVLSGEAWDNGPVVLSLVDVERAGWQGSDNVVLHEFAHKLDMRNGVANGMPPLHSGMDRQAWTDAFSRAYDDLCERMDYSDYTPFNPYATESPAEFFAVMSEAFFATPDRLQSHYPEVYRQLTMYYRQDPVTML